MHLSKLPRGALEISRPQEKNGRTSWRREHFQINFSANRQTDHWTHIFICFPEQSQTCLHETKAHELFWSMGTLKLKWSGLLTRLNVLLYTHTHTQALRATLKVNEYSTQVHNYSHGQGARTRSSFNEAITKVLLDKRLVCVAQRWLWKLVFWFICSLGLITVWFRTSLHV